MTTPNFPATTDWPDIESDLDQNAHAVLKQLIAAEECHALAALYDDPQVDFRSVISMQRYGFGQGEYKYFDYPLPGLVQNLRTKLYPPLARIANHWASRLKQDMVWPDTHDQLVENCHAIGQTRPTPLILRYSAGDYNCLHQDLYGEIHFPLQVIICLSEQHEDFDGGELVLVEQRPRRQSRARVVPMRQGDAVIIPVKDRPVPSKMGWSRNQMRHGVSDLISGTRHTLGIIFHDAG